MGTSRDTLGGTRGTINPKSRFLVKMNLLKELYSAGQIKGHSHNSSKFIDLKLVFIAILRVISPFLLKNFVESPSCYTKSCT